MKKLIILIMGVAFLFGYGCSSSSESTKDESQKDDDIYVFDDVSGYDSLNTETKEVEEDTAANITPEKSTQKVYHVQIGAFSDEKRAKKFLTENSALLDKEAIIKFSERVELFVIQMPALDSREEAENLRNRLWKTEQFDDAWIVTKEK